MTKAQEMRAIMNSQRNKDNDRGYKKHLKAIEKRARKGYNFYVYDHPVGFFPEMEANFKVDGFMYQCAGFDDHVTITIYW